ncbi:MAG TPA: Hsp70 family protein, partial [Pirellulales bacterium]|nr:Hsp70 family protein [Pirellulales bacterium]
LLVEVEEAKRTLSARQSATVRVDHAGSTSTVKVSREKFEQITADLLERTSYTTRQVLAVAGLTWADVNRVLLVGGSTRMPMVSRMLRALTQIDPDQRVHPDEAVARGAAIYAGYLLATQPESLKQPTFAVTNVNSHSLGIEGIDPKTSRKRNVIVIPRNTPLPAKVKEKFVTKAENQRSIVVQVLEGESSIPNECTEIGRTVLRDLPHGLPNGWPVEITYEYGSNGRLKVTAVVPGTHREVNLELEREGALTEEKVARWKQAVSVEGGFDAFSDLVAEELKSLNAGTSFAPVPSHAPATGAVNASALAPESQGSIPLHATRAMPVRPPAPTPVPIPLQPKAQPQAMGTAPGTAQATGQTAPAPAAVSRGQAWSNPVAPMHAGTTPAAAPTPTAVKPARPLLASGSAAKPLLQGDAALRPAAPGAPSQRRSSPNQFLGAVGIGIAAIIGLAIGYYALCFMNPGANFLHLSPGWFPWKMEQAGP